MLDKDKRIRELEELVVILMAKISSLEEELSHYRTKKNSGNSSIPPSLYSYRAKRTASLRKPSDRQAGGQTGH
jgi:hypothetical protein